MATTASSSAVTVVKPKRRVLPLVARLILGLGFLTFGLNGFLNFIPQPKTPMPDAAVAFMTGLIKSGYMMQLIAGTETLVGLMLLAGLFVPLALVMIAPVIVNILAFHIFVMPATIAPGLVVAALEVYLVWAYRDAYRPLAEMRATPQA